jgi:hypothetical protein
MLAPNCGMSWVVVVASDIVINKYLLAELIFEGNWSAHRVVISLFRASRVGPRQA